MLAVPVIAAIAAVTDVGLKRTTMLMARSSILGSAPTLSGSTTVANGGIYSCAMARRRRVDIKEEPGLRARSPSPAPVARRLSESAVERAGLNVLK